MTPQGPANRTHYLAKGTVIATAAITAGFIVLIVSAFLLEGRVTVTAQLPHDKPVRAAETIGTAAYPLADGKTCRELVFDRFNSEIIESKTRRCREPRLGEKNWTDLLPIPPPVEPGRASNGFRWGKS
jgi:hypothetical protein